MGHGNIAGNITTQADDNDARYVRPHMSHAQDVQFQLIHYGWLLLTLTWVILGIVAWFGSLQCAVFRNGTLLQKTGGIAIAIIFGPFFFLYKENVPGYCTPSKPIK